MFEIYFIDIYISIEMYIYIYMINEVFFLSN